MGLTFDHFDELTQTLSGAYTHYDTMGILYQNIPPDPQSMACDENDMPSDSQENIVDASVEALGKSNKRVKKRALDIPEMPLLPYHGRAKMSIFTYKQTNVFSLQDKYLFVRTLDLFWMMNHSVVSNVLPMWTGFNASLSKDDLPRQKVRYMPNLK